MYAPFFSGNCVHLCKTCSLGRQPDLSGLITDDRVASPKAGRPYICVGFNPGGMQGAFCWLETVLNCDHLQLQLRADMMSHYYTRPAYTFHLVTVTFSARNFFRNALHAAKVIVKQMAYDFQMRSENKQHTYDTEYCTDTLYCFTQYTLSDVNICINVLLSMANVCVLFEQGIWRRMQHKVTLPGLRCFRGMRCALIFSCQMSIEIYFMKSLLQRSSRKGWRWGKVVRVHCLRHTGISMNQPSDFINIILFVLQALFWG